MKNIKSLLIKRPSLGRVVRKITSPRRFRLFCVGAPKTGTRSISGLFQKNFRSEHEPHVEEVLGIFDTKKQSSHPMVANMLRKRDLKIWLEVESSHPLVLLIEEIKEEFEESKFILTVRSPLDWLKSIIGHHLKYSAKVGSFEGVWKRIRDIYFLKGKKVKYNIPKERILKKNNLYSIDGYLSHWRNHNKKVIEVIDSERMMVVKTKEISSSIGRISKFLDIDERLIDEDRSHLNKINEKKSAESTNILRKLGRNYVLRKIDDICGDMCLKMWNKFGVDVDVKERVF